MTNSNIYSITALPTLCLVSLRKFFSVSGASILFAAIVASSTLWVHADTLIPDNCYQVKLSTRLDGWPRAAAWLDGTTLLVTDVKDRRVLAVGAQGEVLSDIDKFVPRPNAELKSLQWPSRVRATENGFYIHDKLTGDIVLFDRWLQKEGSFTVKGRQIANGFTLQVVWDWTPMGDGILAFGDLKRSNGDWADSAFLYFDNSGKSQIFYRLAGDSEVRDHYIGDTFHIAVIEDVGYILFLEETPKIVEVQLDQEGVRELGRFPEAFRMSPKFSRAHKGPRRMFDRFQAIEAGTMPVGLYAWNHYLYLLAKGSRNKGNGQTAWWLIKLDPQDGEDLSHAYLPTDAAHLTLAPGHAWWGIIEKSHVQYIGSGAAPYMNSTHVTFVPTSWIENPEVKTPLNQSRKSCTHLFPFP